LTGEKPGANDAVALDPDPIAFDDVIVQILPEPMMFSVDPFPTPDGPVVDSPIPVMSTQGKLPFIERPSAHK
jgi:hypothetical protein